MIRILNIFYQLRFYIYSALNYKMQYDPSLMSQIHSGYQVTYQFGTNGKSDNAKDNLIVGYPHAELPTYKYKIDKKNVKLGAYTTLSVTYNKDYTDHREYCAGAVYSKSGYKYAMFNYLAMFPSTKGVWSGLWTFGINGLPEVDFEHCGQWRRKVTATYHWGYRYALKCKKQTAYNMIFGGAFFKPCVRPYMYTIELTPYQVNWYINGIKVKTIKAGVDNDQRLMATCVVGDYCEAYPQIDELPDQLSIKEITIMERSFHDID